ncbi:hypothetical protein V8J82_06230 [Gymnodinialimonas sp. 2305UL16-5]|uniref:hypothetical protein n=1 Tax=Gymnodinialimonas mytili TaxID=3126503 RepID=UPI003097DD89
MADVTLIVNRNAAVTTLYLSAPAPVMSEAFAGPALEPPEGATFAEAQRLARDAAQHMADHITLNTAENISVARTTSALLHISDDPLRFSTPFEASISTALCTTPDRQLPSLGDLRFYGAFVADIPFEAGPLAVSFNGPFPENMAVDLLYFERGALVSRRSHDLIAGDPIQISPTQSGPGRTALWIALISGFVLVAALSRRLAMTQVKCSEI